jgi:hypothetical protein
MDTQKRFGIALLVIGAALLLGAWWLWGGVDAPEVAQPRRGVGRLAVAPDQPPPYLRREVRAKGADAQLPDPSVAPTTAPCKYIIEWQQQNVHDFVILDNLEAQAQRFNEDDIACLTASGARNAILEYAERNSLYPQMPPGTKGGAFP